MDNTELTELIEKLGLKNHSYTFSVVTLDSENYVTGAYPAEIRHTPLQ